jgi:two-component system, chemotaxis family, CheB/CheR fusion protein
MIFQRLHNKDQHEGTGIPVVITKKIIDKHSGIIAAISEEGKGATFIIILPLKQASTAMQLKDIKQETLQD